MVTSTRRTRRRTTPRVLTVVRAEKARPVRT
jgi:hypothetical protein